MHIERLQQMVTMLRELPPEPKEIPHFHLRYWNCGTTACAIGHATFSPVFMDQGLSWDYVYGVPKFGDLLSWDAVTEFFDLALDRAEHLFFGGQYPDKGWYTTATDVADRIEQFIAENAEV